MSSIAERLREFRTAVGLTQREVAHLCGLGKRTIIYWEMGDREVRCSKLIPLVQEYDLDFNWLLLGSGSMFNTSSLTEPDVSELESIEVDEANQPEPLPGWKDTSPAFKHEQEDVLPLIERLRRK